MVFTDFAGEISGKILEFTHSLQNHNLKNQYYLKWYNFVIILMYISKTLWILHIVL
jgi:hypothetical protein